MCDYRTLKKDLIEKLAYLCDDSAPFGGAPGMNALLQLLKHEEISGDFIVNTLRTIIWGGGDSWDAEEYSRLFWDNVSRELRYESLSPEEKETIMEINSLYVNDASEMFEAIDDFFVRSSENCRLVNHSINRWVCRAITYIDSLGIMNNLAELVFENYEGFYPHFVNDRIMDLLKRRLPHYQAEFILKQINVDVSAIVEHKKFTALSQFEEDLLKAAKTNILCLGTEIRDIIEGGFVLYQANGGRVILR